ncbi:centrosomal protein of 295 kDa-like [Lineus longissimus]|uniref:centrosomal protein of 295 kDa-like n=1 Tax=Lineus longissimus TaxID=88925 RepID=UPI00315DA8B9
MGKKTAAAASSGYRLSPGEVEALIQEEKRKRRIKRILQVREQAKSNAADIRQAVKEEEVKQKKELGKKILKEWESEREEKLKRLEQEYDACLRTIGQGHAEANYVEKENRDFAKQRLSEKDAEIAAARHRDAMLRELDERRAEQMERTKQIRARKAAILKEKERAAKVAALPPPKPDPWAEVELPKHKPVVLVDAEAFSSTYFHMVDEDYAVQKAMSFEQVGNIFSTNNTGFSTEFCQGREVPLIFK